MRFILFACTVISFPFRFSGLHHHHVSLEPFSSPFTAPDSSTSLTTDSTRSASLTTSSAPSSTSLFSSSTTSSSPSTLSSTTSTYSPTTYSPTTYSPTTAFPLSSSPTSIGPNLSSSLSSTLNSDNNSTAFSSSSSSSSSSIPFTSPTSATTTTRFTSRILASPLPLFPPPPPPPPPPPYSSLNSSPISAVVASPQATTSLTTTPPLQPATALTAATTATDSCSQSFDAILLFDKSNSISPDDFLRDRTFAVSLINKFQSLKTDVKIGAIAFGPVETIQGLGEKSVCIDTSEREYQLTDMGVDDTYRGYFDVQGCGRCFDYCRWVGTSSADPTTTQVKEDGSYWSCALAGNKFEVTSKSWYTSWPYQKCSGEGGVSPDPKNTAPLETKLMNITTGTLTPTDLALSEAQADFDANGRPGLLHVIVIITDGVPDSVDAALAAATKAKSAGTLIITVGCNMANDPNAQKVLTDMATPPAEINFINVDSFSQINDALPLISGALTKNCNPPTPSPPTLPPPTPPLPTPFLPTPLPLTPLPTPFPTPVPSPAPAVFTLPPTLPPSLPPSTLPPTFPPSLPPSQPPSTPVSYAIKYPCNAPGCAILEPIQQQPCPVCNHVCPSCNSVSSPCASCGCPCSQQAQPIQQTNTPCPVCGECTSCQKPQPCPSCQNYQCPCGGYGMMMQPAATMVPVIPFFSDNELSNMLYGQQQY